MFFIIGKLGDFGLSTGFYSSYFNAQGEPFIHMRYSSAFHYGRDKAVNNFDRLRYCGSEWHRTAKGL